MNLSEDSAANEDTDGPSNLILRLTAAAIAIPLLVAVIWVGFWAIASATAAASIITTSESVRLLKRGTVRRQGLAAFGVVLLLIPAVAIAYAGLDQLDQLGETPIGWPAPVVIGTAALLTIAAMTAMAARGGSNDERAGAIASYGLLVATSLAALVLTAMERDGEKWIALVLFTVFAADTGAFFVGRSFGRRKLAPDISPGKTVEGLIGGILAAGIASLVLSIALGIDVGIGVSVVLGFVVGILGAAGDLAESWVKRLSGVKESGSIIPGHGGLLDRIDSLAPNFLLVYFVALWAV